MRFEYLVTLSLLAYATNPVFSAPVFGCQRDAAGPVVRGISPVQKLAVLQAIHKLKAAQTSRGISSLNDDAFGKRQPEGILDGLEDGFGLLTTLLGSGGSSDDQPGSTKRGLGPILGEGLDDGLNLLNTILSIQNSSIQPASAKREPKVALTPVQLAALRAAFQARVTSEKRTVFGDLLNDFVGLIPNLSAALDSDDNQSGTSKRGPLDLFGASFGGNSDGRDGGSGASKRQLEGIIDGLEDGFGLLTTLLGGGQDSSDDQSGSSKREPLSPAQLSALQTIIKAHVASAKRGFGSILGEGLDDGLNLLNTLLSLSNNNNGGNTQPGSNKREALTPAEFAVLRAAVKAHVGLNKRDDEENQIIESGGINLVAPFLASLFDRKRTIASIGEIGGNPFSGHEEPSAGVQSGLNNREPFKLSRAQLAVLKAAVKAPAVRHSREPSLEDID